MRKSTVIKLVLSLFVFYIFIQIFSLKNLFKRKSGEHGRQEYLQSAALLDLVFEFATTCRQRDIPIFVIESAVLRSVITVSDIGSRVDCVHLCQAGDVISLGVMGEDWEKKKFLLKDLQKLELAVMEITAPDPRLYRPDKITVPRIPAHYFIHRVGKTRPLIHLVVFHLRADNFLWHSQLPGTNKTGALNIRPDQLSFGSHAGAYDRFPLRAMRVDGISMFLPHTVKEFLAMYPQSHFIECDFHRAQTFLAKHPQDMSDDAQQFQRKARQLMARAKDILDGLGVPFWLSSGTCLGWYRQCGVISYSKDIDLGVRIQDYQEDIVTAFEAQGFTLKHIFGKETDSYELSFKAGEIKIDIFFFYEDNNSMWNGGTEAWTGQKFKYYFPKFGLCWTVFLDLRVRVPCPPLPYVTANYGKNWNTPIASWDWKTSPANVRENGFWPKDEWETVIQVYE